MIVSSFFAALRAGKELTNAKAWKNAQLRTSLLVTIISFALGAAALFGYRLELTPDEITSITIAIGVVGGLLNGATTVATTAKIGLPNKSDNQPDIGSTTSSGTSVVGNKADEPRAYPKPADIFHDRSIG